MTLPSSRITALGPAAAVVLAVLSGCASTRAPAYAERCLDGARPCALSYDFEPSGAAPDPFGKPGGFLVVNEDAALFRWNLAPDAAWDHDHPALVGLMKPALHKVESAASGRCDGTPVFLAASNFMPGRRGPSPERSRVAALVGTMESAPRPLEKVSAAIRALAPEGDFVKVEGIALSTDCHTLYVGLRSRHHGEAEKISREVHPLALDVDWTGTREEAKAQPPFTIDGAGCSGKDEGISDLAALPDGSLLALTSFEETLQPRKSPSDVARGRLSGTLWRRGTDGRVERLACFPGHKPEALAPSADGREVRVIFEDDDYGGRPIQAFAVKVDLKATPALEARQLGNGGP